MAIEYQLKFAEGVAPSLLAHHLRVAGFSDTSSADTLMTRGLTATIGGAHDGADRGRALGFAPRVQVFFGQDKFAPYDDAVVCLVEAVARLLREVPADAAFMGDNEVVLALRRRGALVLTSRVGWWTRPGFVPSLADRLGTPHSYELLPVL